MLDHKTASAQVFEYRPAYKHYGMQHRIWGIAVVILMIALLMTIFIFQSPAPIPDMDTIWQRFISKTTAFDFLYLLPLLISLPTAGAQWLESRSKLTLTQDELIYSRNLPFGLDRFIRTGWRIKLADIMDIQIFASPLRVEYMEISQARIRLQLGSGAFHFITPSVWFIPGSPARQPLKKVQPPWNFFAMPEGWRSPENRAILQKAFADLPLIRELAARNLIVPDYNSSTANQLPDLFAHRSVKFGIVTGLSLAVSALLLMILRQNNHLHDELPMWVYVVLALAALYSFWKIDQKDTPAAPTGNRILAVIFLVGGVIFSADKIVPLLNGVGIDEQKQTFIVHSAYLEPANTATESGRVDLPGKNSRHAWLKEGTEVTLSVKKGRLGLWEYNDEPLRQLADRQGIR